MKEFLKQLVSSGDTISSKRVLSLFFAIIYVGVIVVHLCGVAVADNIVWSLVGLIGAGFGFSSIEKFKNNNYGK